MKNLLERVNYGSLGKRSLLLLIPLILMPFGCACYYACGLGADPFSIFVDGEFALFGGIATHGIITNYNNVVLFSLMLLFGRRYIGLGTVLSSLTFGTVLDLSRNLVDKFLPVVENYYTSIPHWICLIVGCVTFAIGVGMYIVIDFGMGATEFLTIWVSDKTKIGLDKMRIIFDAFWTIVGFFMGGTVGAGTVLGVLATGPISVWTINLAKNFVTNWCGPLLKPAADTAAE